MNVKILFFILLYSSIKNKTGSGIGLLTVFVFLLKCYTAMANENIAINVDLNNMFSEPETSATVWKHFTKTNDKRAVCSLCQKSIKTQGGTTSGRH